MSRKKKSAKNLIYALVGQFFGLLISFFARIFFIKILGEEYLGLNGLFTNILTVLSLAELGVGEAITYSLYKPLANHDYNQCKKLMMLYKKIYITIGILILAIGLVITPFIRFFINESSIRGVECFFILYVLNTAISYFFSYKRNLIIADQNRYIASLYRYLFFFILNFVQIILLLWTKNFYLYLIAQILITFLENYFISKKADSMYSFLSAKEKCVIDDETKNDIKKNTKAMMMHKIGGVVVCSTDNILLSKFVSLFSVGLYSNYYMITNALNIIFTQFYSSLTASIGNLCIEKNINKEIDVFEKINFIGFWIYSFASVCLICLFNPFIELWIGKKYLFSMPIVIIIVINFYTIGIRKAVLTFREAAGLFYKDRWKSVIEAILNLITSIFLAVKFGVFGVFLGTFVSFILVSFWIEPYILYKYEFNDNFLKYFKIYLYYIFLTFLMATFTYVICMFINYNLYVTFLIKLLICLIIPNLFIIIIFKNDKNYLYIKDFIFNYLKKSNS